MTQDDVQALVGLVRDGDAAEASLDPGALGRVKAGLEARAKLGMAMDLDKVYSTANRPSENVWIRDPETGMAVEVMPVPFATPPAQTLRNAVSGR